MRRFYWAGLLLIVIGGCKPKIPENIIQPDKIGLVLYDIHIVDGYIASIPKADSAKKVSAAYYKGVYKKFAIDSALFTKSMDYYYNHPDELSKIYEGVTASLKKSKDSLDKDDKKYSQKAEAIQKLKSDSAAKANPKTGVKPATVIPKKDNAYDEAESFKHQPKGPPQGALKN